MTLAVGFDGGESAQRALDAAIEFARDLEETILVVCGVAPAGGMGEEYQATEAAVLEELSPAVLKAVAKIQALGLTAEAVLVDSDPVGALETVMVERKPRMVIVGYGQPGRIKAALLGAVAHRIVEISDVPVLVVP